jgi:hypothetical protein
MNDQQATGPYYPSSPPASAGVFGTKIPSTVTFAVGVLLFLLPFAELKCKAQEEKKDSLINFSKLRVTFTNTGLGLAAGSDWKINMLPIDGLFNENNRQRDEWKKNTESKPNAYAIVALALAVLGLGLSFTSSRPWIAVSIVAGALSAAALIGLMLDLQNKSKDLILNSQQPGNRPDMGNGSGFILSFTPWFYVAVIALIVAAFFSYKRMQSLKT